MSTPAPNHFDSVLVALPPGVAGRPLTDAASKLLAGQGTLHLLTVVRVGEEEAGGTAIARAEQALEQVTEYVRGDGVTVRWGVAATMGAPGAEIVSAAEQLGVAAIVIGGSNRTRVGKFLMGSDAQTVLLTSPVPVLSVPR
ncbi:universal stress protein [Ornithinimicrobium cavernae]|uniref:universal stress protein n=1 Tax=Ornithinimicrobium cavernae TaxID=2666047 RepID=UPI000D69DF04|nr:universal stress protein [Ornithinimicrobium cavernae]